MNEYFMHGFTDELTKLAFRPSPEMLRGAREFLGETAPYTGIALGSIVPGAIVGGGLGAGLGAITGKEGEKGKQALKDAILGALLGGGLTTALAGATAGGLGSIFGVRPTARELMSHHVIPGAVAGGTIGAAHGALSADDQSALRKALLSGTIGAAIGGLGGAAATAF